MAGSSGSAHLRLSVALHHPHMLLLLPGQYSFEKKKNGQLSYDIQAPLIELPDTILENTKR